MKRKIWKFLLSFGFLAALLLFACDMTRINELDDPDGSDGRTITENERDELEKTGRFLKLVNMPLHTQTLNVVSVSVANSSTAIGKLDKDNTIFIFRDAGSCTVYLPLVYNSGEEFLETGFFYTAFAIHIDALTKYVVDVSDRFIVHFTNGRGQADVNNLPVAEFINPVVTRELSVMERDEMENTGRFLKLVNMPLNTQMPNVFSVSIANSSSSVGKLNKNIPVSIYRDADSCTVYLPLVYNDESEFLETGFFYAAFTIHIDALTKYVVDVSDRFIIPFTDGRGQADINNIPAAPVEEFRFLTVFNLPQTVSVYNFGKVFIHNQAGAVAYCADYSQIVLSVDNNKAAAKIPLHYQSLKQIFTETGNFYVVFDINVDAETRFTLTLDDRVIVSFINGNGILDILNIPDKPVPYLTIKGLPLNAVKQHVSNVNVYNRADSVANCADYKNVVVFKDSEYSTFLIPLSSSNQNGYFQDSGRFAVSFTFNIDFDTQFVYSRSDDLILPFTNGSAEIDISTFFGFFEASLLNMDNSARPVIKAGSSFDVNGHRCTVSGNYTVNALTPGSSCIMYLYAYYAEPDFYYEFSAVEPAYNTKRKGWYNGSRRALWKMIFLNSSSQFLFKTSMKEGEDSFPQFGTAVLTNSTDYSQFIASKPVSKSVNGASNSLSETLTLDPGVYVLVLNGAGGGRGSSYNGTSSSGGSGGSVKEIITLNSKTSFTAFTGSAGGDAPAPSASGTFSIVTTKNTLKYTTHMEYESGAGSFSYFDSHELQSSDTILSTVSVTNTNTLMSGGSGGGGGSGTFLYCPEGKYLLVAGGGGGGSGGSYLTPGGAGGAGGSFGPGAGGGGSGRLSQTSAVSSVDYPGNYSAPGGAGGKGGGYGGGSAGAAAGGSGGNATALLSANAWHSGGTGAASYTSSSFNVSSNIPFLYASTGLENQNKTEITTLPILSIRTSFSISGNSGSGGSAGALSYPTGPESWLHTAGIGGNGGSSSSLNSVSVSGSVSPTDTRPGKSGGNWNDGAAAFTSTLTLRIGSSSSGQSGSDGGNNRNSTKSGGAASGEAGSVTIYKIY